MIRLVQIIVNYSIVKIARYLAMSLAISTVNEHIIYRLR